ncbi:hypothetical protein DIPPA_23791 [Diplonema papillatum]|nr:hypothetical protein DIPPA_23791 [Diplonema papillatum]
MVEKLGWFGNWMAFFRYTRRNRGAFRPPSSAWSHSRAVAVPHRHLPPREPPQRALVAGGDRRVLPPAPRPPP